ncbi:M28 family peptidase [Caldithrix abyssi]|uniref:Peptidase M28 n=1 Tax=Caldithrix abyssi DSM 13497 TaxID=880073 RepID=H1XYL7_CALAY|nr:M28 family peptidase [Caldithrix abyssi]APF19725.1 Peptidase family M28 [Caldithrix abyssi DSM 13497]EHO39835.1 peptidase M28 [Caldithrix abyssi DSM 13497]
MKRVLFFFVLFALHTTLVAQFNDQRAFQYLVKQVAFGPRNPNSEGHQKCLEFLHQEFKQFADTVILQPFEWYDAYHKKTLKLTNVIARFQPQNERRIFLAAHWDTRPRADMDTEENKNTPIPGANDGASGVAVLLEIARVLQMQPPTNIGVDLVLFDGEDYGRQGHLEEYFLGSRYFAKHYHRLNFSHEFGILIDMIGDAQLNLKREGYSVKYLPWLVDRVWKTAQNMGYYEFSDQFLGYVDDDHVPLLEAGIPCINIIDFDYPYWHTLEDTPDKCSPQSLGIIGRVLLEVIYEQ